MKLFYCPECQDILKFGSRYKSHFRVCDCGKSGARYIDDIRGQLIGKAIPIGVDNPTFGNAILERPLFGRGSMFTVFVIPEQCDNIIN